MKTYKIVLILLSISIHTLFIVFRKEILSFDKEQTEKIVSEGSSPFHTVFYYTTLIFDFYPAFALIIALFPFLSMHGYYISLTIYYIYFSIFQLFSITVHYPRPNFLGPSTAKCDPTFGSPNSTVLMYFSFLLTIRKLLESNKMKGFSVFLLKALLYCFTVVVAYASIDQKTSTLVPTAYSLLIGLVVDTYEAQIFDFFKDDVIFYYQSTGNLNFSMLVWFLVAAVHLTVYFCFKIEEKDYKSNLISNCHSLKDQFVLSELYLYSISLYSGIISAILLFSFVTSREEEQPLRDWEKNSFSKKLILFLISSLVFGSFPFISEYFEISNKILHFVVQNILPLVLSLLWTTCLQKIQCVNYEKPLNII